MMYVVLQRHQSALLDQPMNKENQLPKIIPTTHVTLATPIIKIWQTTHVSNTHHTQCEIKRKHPPWTKRSTWIDQALEEAMEVVEAMTHSLWKASRSWGILLTSLFDHLNNKIKSRKMGSTSVLTKEEDKATIEWTLAMQECGLSITIQ
jgi:hypothetical protein